MTSLTRSHSAQASFYTANSLSRPAYFLDRFQVYEQIRSDKQVRQDTLYIQQQHAAGIQEDFVTIAKAAYQNDKKHRLSAVCFNGANRADLQKSELTGIINLDIDENTQQELDTLRADIRAGKIDFIEAAALSVSGIYSGAFWTNIKIEFPARLSHIKPKLRKLLGIDLKADYLQNIDKLNKAYHKALSYIFKAQAGIKVGSSKDLKRVRYITHDSEIYVNEQATTYSLQALEIALNEIEQQQAPVSPSGSSTQQELDKFSTQAAGIKAKDAFQFAEKFAQLEYNFEQGSKHLFLTRFSIACNLLGVKQQDAEQFVKQKYIAKIGSNCIEFPYSKYKDSAALWAHKIAATDIKPDYTLHLQAGEKLSKHAEPIKKIYTGGCKLLDMSAGTQIGKTYLYALEMPDYFKQLNNCATVIIQPLNTLVYRTAEQYNLPYITGEQQDADKYKAALQAPVFIANQNSADTIALNCQQTGRRLNVIIDESHTLVSGVGYRPEVVQELYKKLEVFAETVTLLSGTAKPYFKLTGFKSLQVTQESRPQIIVKPRYTTQVAELTALQHIEQTDFSSGKVVLIKIQSKNKIDLIYNKLLKSGYTDKQVLRLYSEKHIKQSEQYKLFCQAKAGGESFAESVIIVLCTSFINDGIDIYSSREIETVNVEKNRSFDIDAFVQFADRHRTKKEKTVISYHLEPTGKEPDKKQFNPIFEFKQLLKFWEGKADEMRQAQASGSEALLKSLRTQYSDSDKYLFIDKDTQQIKVNKLALMYLVEEMKVKRTDTLSGYTEIKSKYKYFEIEDFEQPDAEQPDDKLLAELKAAERLNRKQIQSKIQQLFTQSKEAFLSAVYYNTQDKQLRRKIRKHSRGDSIKAKQLIDANTQIFERYYRETETLTKRYCNFKSLLLCDDDIQAQLFKYDDDIQADAFQSGRYLSVFTEKLKIQLLLLFFTLSHRHKTELLSVLQAQDAKLFNRIIEAFTGDEKHEFTSTEIHHTILNVYKRGKRLSSNLSEQKAVRLFNILFAAKRNTERTGYIIERQVSIKEVFTEYSINTAKFNDNLTQLLKNEGFV